MFGHLSHNQPAIFHICHGLILPLPSLPPPFFSRRSFLPIFGAGAERCIVLPFPWTLAFHQWPGFAFELNQINLLPDKDTVSVCIGEGRRLHGRHDAHMSRFQPEPQIHRAARTRCPGSRPKQLPPPQLWLRLSMVTFCDERHHQAD